MNYKNGVLEGHFLEIGYYLNRHIGDGGTGTVYEFSSKRKSERDSNHGLVIKLSPLITKTESDPRHNSELSQRLREMMCCTIVESNSLLPVYEVGTLNLYDPSNGHAYPFTYIVMQRADQTADALLKSLADSNAITLAKLAKTILVRVVFALADLHEKEIIHRDVALDNIFLVDGEFLLGDLGAAVFGPKTTFVELQPFKSGYPGKETGVKEDSSSPKTDILQLAFCILYVLQLDDLIISDLLRTFTLAAPNQLALEKNTARVLTICKAILQGCHESPLLLAFLEKVLVKHKVRPTSSDLRGWLRSTLVDSETVSSNRKLSKFRLFRQVTGTLQDPLGYTNHVQSEERAINWMDLALPYGYGDDWKLEYRQGNFALWSEKTNLTLRSTPIGFYLGGQHQVYYPEEVVECFRQSKAKDGNTPAFSNDDKLRLSSDLIAGQLLARPEVKIQMVKYFTHIATAESIAFQFKILDGEGELVETYDPSQFTFMNGRILRLDSTLAANQIGISSLLITSDKHIVLLIQGDGNIAEAKRIMPSGSGSMDYSDLKDGINTLQSLVSEGMEREIREETGLKKTVPNARYRTQVTGHCRILQRGGKPEFFGVTVTNAATKLSSGERSLTIIKEERKLTHRIWSEQIADFSKDGLVRQLRGIRSQYFGTASLQLDMATQLAIDFIMHDYESFMQLWDSVGNS